MLQAHAYWRLHGLKADLVILNEESSGYEQPLQEQLKRLIHSHSMHAGVDQPGGVYLRNADHITDEDLTLILSAARVALVAARGPLPQQLGAPTEAAELPDALPVRTIPEEPSAPLPFMELPYFNGLGGFTPDGREYAIYLGPGAHTPAPWVNVIANPSFGTLVSESGAGFAWYGNSQQNRLTGWSNDPVSDTPSEALYIRDQETGKFWTPTPLPIREMDAYRARHGAGYTVFEHNSHAIQQELTTFVPMDENGGEPVRVQRLRLRNDSSRIRRLSVTFYVEWTLGENREDSQTHVISQWDSEMRTMLARNRYHSGYGDRVAFATISPAPHSYTADRTGFLGRNGTLAAPAAMKRIRLSGRVWPGLDPCAAVQVVLNLPPGDSAEVTCLLGQAGSIEEVDRLVQKYRDPVEVEESLNRTIAWWDRLLGSIQISTPEKSADILLNRWLLYQALSCRIWGRTGFYQSSGAFGFRDQLQDVMALVYAEPAIARQHILRAAGRQFSEGDVQHWWQPPSGAGIRTRCSDDMLWLPYVVAHYVRLTGDAAILNERIPFIEDRALEEKEHEAFMTPHESLDSATLYEHCRRAIERGMRTGPHGLPLIGSGDWNDGMNRVGIKGSGESIWLAWFLIGVLNEFAGMTKLHGSPEHVIAYRERARHLAEAVERHAWDGGWYLRAFFDDGTPLGSAASEEARIDSLPQSWAVLSGAADAERAARAVESACEQLVLKDENLVLLLAPPFDRSEKNPGYIKGYPAGVRENGSQYTHAALWLVMALCRRGDGDRAVSLLRMINPIERARDPEAVERYRVEPYVAAGDVYRLPERVGQGGWTWYTGSAAGMYRVWIEEVLGMKICDQVLVIDPVIPSGWKQFSIRYRRGEAIYDIAVENPEGARRGVAWVEMDGRRLEKPLIPLEEISIKHKVVVRMGKGA
jgi:cyclic beta-1,2-glucan synthetase